MGGLKRIWDFVNYWYLQYTLCTALYMLEPLERRILNSILLATMAMGVYTMYLFWPGHQQTILHYMQYFFGDIGDTGPEAVRPDDIPKYSV